MSKIEFATYSRALEAFDCAAANRVLNKAFVRHYPVFKDARLGPHCPKSINCYHWRGYARVRFMELGYCHAVTKLREAEAEIRQRKIRPVKFKSPADWNKRAKYNNQWIKMRDLNLAILIGKSRSGFIPALLKVAELVRVRAATFSTPAMTSNTTFSGAPASSVATVTRTLNASNNCAHELD